MSTCVVITADDLLSKRILIVAPHMDDEVLGCGGVIHMHADKNQVHCIYATDGANSPAPLLPWTGSVDAGLAERRRLEAMDVMDGIGVPHENLTFLDFPDGKLMNNMRLFKTRIAEELSRIKPAIVLVPFRYDLHSDHVAAHRGVREAFLEEESNWALLEYFIYHRWRLIRSGDVRQMIPVSRLLKVDISNVADKKAAAIHGYSSQTEILCDWQEQPILTAHSIAERCAEPEWFLYSDPREPLSAIFTRSRLRTVASHYILRFGKRRKDQVIALLRWLFRFGNRKDA